MGLDGQWLKHWGPDWTDHDAGINVVIRPPPLFEVVWAQERIGGLQRFDYGHEQSCRLRLVGLSMQVEEPADHIYPIHPGTFPVLMIAAVQDDLQLIPDRVEIPVGQPPPTHSS